MGWKRYTRCDLSLSEIHIFRWLHDGIHFVKQSDNISDNLIYIFLREEKSFWIIGLNVNMYCHLTNFWSLDYLLRNRTVWQVFHHSGLLSRTVVTVQIFASLATFQKCIPTQDKLSLSRWGLAVGWILISNSNFDDL